MKPGDRVAPGHAVGHPSEDALDRRDVADQHAELCPVARERQRAELATGRGGEHAFDGRSEQRIARGSGERRVAEADHQRATPTLERERAEADERELGRELGDHRVERALADVEPAVHARAERASERPAELARGQLAGSSRERAERGGGNDHGPAVVRLTMGIVDGREAYLTVREVERNRLLRVERRMLHGRSHITPFRARGALWLVAFVATFLVSALAAAKPKPSDAGAAVGPIVERPGLPLRSCDAVAPVCVHAAATISPEVLVRARRAFAEAWGAVVDTLRVPRPISDGALGGDARLDVYLVPDLATVPRALDGLSVGRDALDLLSDRDSASSFLVLDERVVRASGCVLASTAVRGIVRSSALGLDVAESEVVVDGFARRIGEVVAPCPAIESAAFAEIQARPWRSILATSFGPELVARTLDLSRGQGFGAIVPGVLSMAINHHGIVVPREDDELGPAHFHDDPSAFEVIAASLSDAGSSLEALWTDVAVVRATSPIPPAWEWSVPASTLPRRFAIRRAIEPTGSTFVRIDVDKTPPSDSIEMDLAWDGGSRFAWRVLKLDAAGKILGEVPVPSLETTRKITIDVRHLAGVKTIVLAGVNVGDPIRPWRATEPPSQPHGYELGIFVGS